MTRSHFLKTIILGTCLILDVNQGFASSSEKCASALDQVINNFRAITQIYHPSRGEERLRKYIISIAEQSNYEFTLDNGNLFVDIPARGDEFQNKPTVILQSHLDMVITQADVSEEFKIDLVETDGWLHSRNQQTTIGADNGIGVAMMMRYMNPEPKASLNHPPLRLLFTWGEEIGMLGVGEMTLPLKANVLINLDYIGFPRVCVGCVAIKTLNAEKTNIPVVTIPKPYHQGTLKLSGLIGGHGGVEVPFDRANAVKLLTELLIKLHKNVPNLYVADAIVGDGTPNSKIPTYFKADIAYPKNSKSAVETTVQSFLDEIKSRFHKEEIVDDNPPSRGENPGLIKLKFKSLKKKQLHKKAFPKKKTSKLLKIINKLPYGIVATHPQFPDEPYTISNISTLVMSAQERRMFTSSMPRSFDAEVLVDMQTEFSQLFSRSKFTLDNPITLPGWLLKQDDWLLQLFLEKYGKNSTYGFERETVLGGLEVAFFAEKYSNQNLAMLALGPNIKGEHEVIEKVELASTEKLIGILDDLLIQIAHSPEFQSNQ